MEGWHIVRSLDVAQKKTRREAGLLRKRTLVKTKFWGRRYVVKEDVQ